MQVHACMLCTFFNVLPYWIITHVSLSVSVSFWFPHIFAVPGFRSFSEFWFFSPVFWSLFFRFIFSNPGFFRFRFSVFQFCSYFSVFEFLFLFFRFLIFFWFPVSCMHVFPYSSMDRKESRNWRRNGIVKPCGFSHKSRKPTDYRYKKEGSTVSRLSLADFSAETCHNEAAQPSVAGKFS